VLGDRPVWVSICRAWHSLGLPRRLALLLRVGLVLPVLGSCGSWPAAAAAGRSEEEQEEEQEEEDGAEDMDEAEGGAEEGDGALLPQLQRRRRRQRGSGASDTDSASAALPLLSSLLGGAALGTALGETHAFVATTLARLDAPLAELCPAAGGDVHGGHGRHASVAAPRRPVVAVVLLLGQPAAVAECWRQGQAAAAATAAAKRRKALASLPAGIRGPAALRCGPLCALATTVSCALVALLLLLTVLLRASYELSGLGGGGEGGGGLHRIELRAIDPLD
jgi:hypothetical protein